MITTNTCRGSAKVMCSHTSIYLSVYIYIYVYRHKHPWASVADTDTFQSLAGRQTLDPHKSQTLVALTDLTWPRDSVQYPHYPKPYFSTRWRKSTVVLVVTVPLKGFPLCGFSCGHGISSSLLSCLPLDLAGSRIQDSKV